MKNRLIAAGVGVALAAGLSACGSSSSGAGSAKGTISVVAGENFYGNIVSQIGGSHVKVTSIISDPNTDPHEYESSAKNAAEIESAQLVVDNGVGYDDFMNQLLQTAPNSNRTVITASKVLGIGGSNPNPHLWYFTAKMPELANAIAADLSKIQPDNAATFKANAAAFTKSLAPITAVTDKIKAKYAGTKIAYTERVPGYLVQAAGLDLGIPASFTQAVEDGDDPSPADTAAFDQALKTHTVKALLYNAQVTDSQTDQLKALAKSSGVPIVPVTETMPPTAKNYQSWQLSQAQALLTALGG